MKIGVIFPQTEFGTDIGALKEWTQAVEKLGLSHIAAFDHVIGANKASRPGWNPPYDIESQFYEPLALFCFMAAITRTVGFLTNILILPQRQTVLVAKQAACLDVLCNGRLRLGVGTGWNQVEYETLNVPFKRRGEIFDDQIGVLRELWTKPAVSLKTPYHTIVDAGINPLPVQRPIPLWFGGGSPAPFGIKPNIEKVTRRIARIADGWVPSFARLVRNDKGAGIVTYNDEGAESVEKFRSYVREYGRDPAKIGLEGSVSTFRKTEATWVDSAKFWKKLGANYMSINTMLDGLRGCEEHLRRLEEAVTAIRAGI